MHIIFDKPNRVSLLLWLCAVWQCSLATVVVVCIPAGSFMAYICLQVKQDWDNAVSQLGLDIIHGTIEDLTPLKETTKGVLVYLM